MASAGRSEARPDPARLVSSIAVTVFGDLKYDERIEERLNRRQDPIRRGSDQVAPPLVRELMALNRSFHESPRQREGRLSFWERPSHALPDREEPAARTMLVGRGRLVVSNDW